MTVPSDATISPSTDFFGLVAGASGRWMNDPPQTDPVKNASVSKTNVRPITATTTAVSNVVRMISSEPGQTRGSTAARASVRPMLPTTSLRCGAGTVMYQRKVASTPSDSIEMSPASPW